MIPVTQSDTSSTTGDCLRATVASLFELKVEQVPHFQLYHVDIWWDVFVSFIWGLGYEVTDVVSNLDTPIEPTLQNHVLGSVKTNYEGNLSHAVILDTEGVVVHDPLPNKFNQGKNAIQENILIDWFLITKR